MAIFGLQLVGLSATTALQLFSDDLSNSTVGIDFDIWRLTLCDQNCPELNLTNNEDTDDDSKTNESVNSHVVILLIMVVLLITLVLILFCLIFYYLRYVCT